MLVFPEIDPVALQLGPLSIRWYGLMYLVGFLAALWLGNHRAQKPGSVLTKEQVGDLIFYGALGVILGGRFGYVIFYNFPTFLEDPLWLFRVWEGGMSFHGGLLGVILAMFLYARRIGCSFFALADFTAPLVPIGLGAGRVGNFIGGELWGRTTEVSWGMVFPHVDDLPRHPSQLYQFALEGVALFLILWFFSAKPKPRMTVSGLFLLCYGVFRFIVEFVREPDGHLQFVLFEWVTMGQLLSLPMIGLGIFMMVYGYRANTSEKQTA